MELWGELDPMFGGEFPTSAAQSGMNQAMRTQAGKRPSVMKGKQDVR